MIKSYVDNAENRRYGHVGKPIGTIPQPSSASNANVHVDNDQTRNSGRLGQPPGTAVAPAPRAHSPKCAVRVTNSPSPRLKREPTDNEHSSTTTSKTNADNAENRRLRRFGQSHDTAVVSKRQQRNTSLVFTHTSHPSHCELEEERNASLGTIKNQKRYVDNEYNRNLGRVGLLHGEAVVYKNGYRTKKPNIYAYTPLNKKRYSESKSNLCDGHLQTHTSHPSHCELEEERNASLGTIKNQKRYVDNEYNRNLGRVGLLHGEAVVYKNGYRTKKPNVYADTPLNKKRWRVGKPQGSMHRKSIVTDKLPEIIEELHNQDDTTAAETRNGAVMLDDFSESKNPTQAALQHAICHHNLRVKRSWQMATKETPKTETSILKDYKGKKIAYDELKLHARIGRGRFGEVFFAKWQETVVAVKALRTEKFTDKDIITFAKEVLKLCELNHPNIVKFIGACTEMPDVCIVMEYMQYSLFDAIHVRKIEFTDEEILSITRQVCKGMTYLHERGVAHCDIKTANILMDYVENNICEAKITDFGFSMMIQNSTLSLSDEYVRYRGTPRYSAPEILRGEELSARDMMHVDVYSLGLVLFEIIYSEEPYHDFTAVQMQKQVGVEGVTPEISNDIMVDQDVLDIIHMAWKFEPHLRPKARNISYVLNRSLSIFIEHES